jgi:hypothetical protein
MSANATATAAVTLDHLSHSQVQTFTACPRKWHFDKVEHAPRERVGAALIFGIALHDALAGANEAALAGERIDAAARFLVNWKGTIEQAAVPVHYGRDGADDLLAKGRALAAAYVPPPGIIGVEQPVTIRLDPDLPPVLGRIDLIRRIPETGELAIADLKTSSSRLLTETDAVEAQMGLYNIACQAARHEAVVLGKLKVATVTIQQITPWKAAQVAKHYLEVHAAMEAGVRYAVRGWQCESCPFADRCRKEG